MISSTNNQSLCDFQFPKINSDTFRTMFMQDNELQYDTNFDIIYYDIEAVTLNHLFPNIDNEDSYISTI